MGVVEGSGRRHGPDLVAQSPSKANRSRACVRVKDTKHRYVGSRHSIAEANAIISRLDDQQHVFYMDIGAKFLDDRGYFLPDTFRPDNLHPLAKGYDIWGEAVRAKLAELLK